MTGDRFELAALVREVHDTTDLVDHRQVAKEVRGRIPDAEVEAALVEALTVYVRVHFSVFRGPGPKLGKPGTKSWKRDGVREWWNRDLNCRYDTETGQRLLRDFTRDDCLYQAVMLRQKAAEMATKAEAWEHLAARLADRQTVGELA